VSERPGNGPAFAGQSAFLPSMSPKGARYVPADGRLFGDDEPHTKEYTYGRDDSQMRLSGTQNVAEVLSVSYSDGDAPWFRGGGPRSLVTPRMALAARFRALRCPVVCEEPKYGPEGQRVTLGSACSEGELRVDGGDRGPGIPETELPHIFERFYRLAGAEEPGSGLGLSIAQTIVEAHGGRIEAQSQPGEGTRMSFILPLLQEGSKVR
jgi:hypothetical protein